MVIMNKMARGFCVGLAVWGLSCGDDRGGQAGTDAQTEGIDLTATDPEANTSGAETSDTGGETSGEPPSGCANIDAGCRGQIDLLFIIDNSGSMGEEQLNLARNLPLLIQQLESLTDIEGNQVTPDVNIMVTTTDSGNPLCEPFYPPGPENGSPISSACTQRLERFTSIGTNPINMEDACTSVCPQDVAPEGDFIHFSSSDSNVPDTPPADVNGDGVDDSAVAQALACIGPQGIDGCGYESPLDAMLEALDPEAPWNTTATPFLRGGSLLAVAVITDEADCSVADASIMTDESLMETHPDSGDKVPTSAICWNAGVTCDGPDADGVYADCTSSASGLRPVDEYTAFLQGLNRPVVMLGILGVPPVTERAEEPPFQPLAGGVTDLVYRDWQDPDYAGGGDILPEDWDAGRDAAYKQYQFGIGPGCTGEDGSGGFTGQAIPPVRVKEVCESLDQPDNIRCCIESICDTDFSPALQCLSGLIKENVIPQG